MVLILNLQKKMDVLNKRIEEMEYIVQKNRDEIDALLDFINYLKDIIDNKNSYDDNSYFS